MTDSGVDREGSFYPTVDALSSELDALFAAGDFAAALTRLQAFVQGVILDRRALAKVFAEPLLDDWCQRIGAAVAAQIAVDATPVEPVAKRADCLFLATEVYRAGGHTAVMQDLVRTGRFGPDTVLMLTDALHQADAAIVDERFGDSVFSEIAPAGTLLDKLRWTLQRIAYWRPRRVVLFNHHHDPVAIAAAQPGCADETVFYHHGDHQLCLGVTLDHTLHVDPHPMGYHHCREQLGLRNNVYWPLVAKDQHDASSSGRMPSRDGLRTCSSGSHNKFEQEYRYRYVDVLPELLAATRGTHTHIGPLSDATLALLRERLDALGVPQERFVHMPWVASVWQALHENAIDVYIVSFPLGGGRVMIEAMGAGVPIVAHDCYQSRFLGGKDMLYGSAFVWRHPQELISHLTTVQPERLAAEARDAREHYERYHTDAALARHIDGGRDLPPAPALGPHRGDPMQEFLDDVRYALTDHLTLKDVAPLLESERRFDEQVAHARNLEREVERTRGFEVQLMQEQRRMEARNAELAQTSAMCVHQTKLLGTFYAEQTAELMRHFSSQLTELKLAVIGAQAREVEYHRRIREIEASRTWRLALRLQSCLRRLRLSR